MRAAILREPSAVAVENVDTPEPTATDVLVRVRYVGLCGTDLELLHGTSPYLADGRSRYPHSFGHEWVGVVEEVGSAVDDVEKGETVTGSTMLFCRHCAECSAGRRNLCHRLREIGLYGHPGAAAEYLVMPRSAVVSFGYVEPAPAHVLIEPMVTVLEGLHAAPVAAGDRVLVVGAGTIGSLAVTLLSGTATVDIADPRPVGHLDRNLYRHRYEAVPEPGAGYDVVVEASGASGTLAAAVAALRPGGTCLLLGVSVSPETLAPGLIALSGIRIVGVRHGVDHYPRAVSLFDELADVVGNLVDSVVPLADVDRAFNLLGGARDRPKVVISLD